MDRDQRHIADTDSFEFGHALANHLPMVRVALRRLGANPARLQAFSEQYRMISGLVPPPPRVAPITRENWAAPLGDRRRETDFRDFFHGELQQSGPQRLLETTMPLLLPGVAASALHALMRLAYAHLEDDSSEMATALAYWATTFLPLPSAGGNADMDDPAAVLAGMAAFPHLLAIQPETDLLWHAMRAVGADPVFAAHLDRLGAARLPRFAAAALALQAGAPSFCALHAVTSLHWVRLLPATGIDRPALLRHLWRALSALYPKMGMPVLPSPEALDAMRRERCPDWPEIAAAAIASDDEHDHSLVFSAREEEAVYGDRLYRVVAARQMGLMA